MQALLAASRRIDAATAFVGRAVKWLILVAVLVSAGNAIIRKVFDLSSNAWLELQWYLFGAVFMLAAAYTLQKNEHIRIDVLSARLKKRTRDWIDLICHIVFLLPFVLMMVWLSTPFVIESYVSQEMSMNSGGLIIWPAKATILAGFILLLAQAISEIIKRIAVLAGQLDDPIEPNDMPPLVKEAMGAGRSSDRDGGAR